MHRGRGGGGGGGGMDPFSNFGDPFGSFGGGFGQHRSLMSSFFGGRDPFDDPFFTRPFGGMFESSFFGSNGSPFGPIHPPPFMEHKAIEPPKKSRGPIIEELNSDDEDEAGGSEKKENPRKHGRENNEPYVEDPDDAAEERKSRHLLYRNSRNMFSDLAQPPQTQSYTFQSSTVTYGGSNGAYYTSSKTRRTGSDGVTFEENKEADSTTREASHRVSRGLYNKGHTLTRKLNLDGKVDSMQTLHNLEEDELGGFEEAWRGTARQALPGLTGNFSGHDNMGASGSTQANRGGWALPSTEHGQRSKAAVPEKSGEREVSRMPPSGRTKASSNGKEKSGGFFSRGKRRE